MHIDADRLVELASKADVVLEVLPAIGDFVPAGSALVRVEGVPRHDIAAEILRRITLDTERSLAQDLAYGPRLLVDICVRSLGEPFDPTTAVQAIDRIHDFLRRLSTRKFPTGEYRDETGTVRLVIRTLTWDDYVRLSLEEIRIGSGSSVQAIRRLRYCLEDLLQHAPKERRGADRASAPPPGFGDRSQQGAGGRSGCGTGRRSAGTWKVPGSRGAPDNFRR